MTRKILLAALLIAAISTARAQLQFLQEFNIYDTKNESREMVEGPVIFKDKYYCNIPENGIFAIEEKALKPVFKNFGFHTLTATNDRLYFGASDIPSYFASINPENPSDYVIHKYKDERILTSGGIYDNRVRGYILGASPDKKYAFLTTVSGNNFYSFLVENTSVQVGAIGNVFQNNESDTFLRVTPGIKQVFINGNLVNMSMYRSNIQSPWRRAVNVSFKSNKYVEGFNKEKVLFKNETDINLWKDLFRTDSNHYLFGSKKGEEHPWRFYKFVDTHYERVKMDIPDTSSEVIPYLYQNKFFLVSNGNIAVVDEKDWSYKRLAKLEFPDFERMTKDTRLLFQGNYVYYHKGGRINCLNLQNGTTTPITQNAVAALQSQTLKENDIYGYATDKYFFWVEQNKGYQEIHRFNPQTGEKSILPFPEPKKQESFTFINANGSKLLMVAQAPKKGKDPNTAYRVFVYTDE